MKVSTDFVNQRIVVDCSVLIKPFLSEPDSLLIEELIEMHKKQQLALMATPLVTFELLNVLSKNLKNPDAVAESYKKYRGINLITLDLRDDFIEEAYIRACMQNQISYYDAAYHALAKDMDGIFLTADRKYFEVMKGEGNIVLYE